MGSRRERLGIAEQVILDVSASGGVLHFLDLGMIESLNGIWKQYHRGLLTEAKARQAQAELKKAPVVLVDASPLLNDAFDIALKYDVVVYDACFVAAVQRLGCRGVTADVPLVQKVGAAFPSIILLKDW